MIVDQLAQWSIVLSSKYKSLRKVPDSKPGHST